MLRPRSTRRRLANSYEISLRNAVPGEAAMIARAEAAPGESIVLPPPVPTSDPTPSAAPTGPPVNVPKGASVVVPVAAAVAGVLLVAFLVWHFWYRRKQRLAKQSKRGNWHTATKYSPTTEKSMKDGIPSTKSSSSPSSSGKVSATTYPPRKVSAQPRTGQRDRPAHAPSPLRNQAKLDSASALKSSTAKPAPKPKSPATAATTPAPPASPSKPTPPAGALSPISEDAPLDKTDFTTPIPRPTASSNIPEHMRFSFLRDVNKLPNFKADPTRIQPVKRSASLVSSRMSVKRKPQRQDTAPAESSELVVPSLSLTDTDSPLQETSEPPHPLEGKMVTCTDPYDATLPDELTITVGETLRVVEAYDDDWCLAERIGRKKGRGIVPQICVTEKGGVRHNMRFSMLRRD